MAHPIKHASNESAAVFAANDLWRTHPALRDVKAVDRGADGWAIKCSVYESDFAVAPEKWLDFDVITVVYSLSHSTRYKEHTVPNPSSLAMEEEHNGIHQEFGSVRLIESLKKALDEREKDVEILTRSTSIFAANALEQQEIAQRHRQFNADSVEEIRALRSIARAAARERAAGFAYAAAEDKLFAGQIFDFPDSVVQELAEAEADLEAQLIKQGFARADGTQVKER